MGKVHYESHIETPELARVCLGCEREDCAGICDEYKNAYRALLGLPLLQVREPPKPPREKRVYVYVKDTLIEYNGEAHTLDEWAGITGIPYKIIYSRARKWKDVDVGRIFKKYGARRKARAHSGMQELQA